LVIRQLISLPTMAARIAGTLASPAAIPNTGFGEFDDKRSAVYAVIDQSIDDTPVHVIDPAGDLADGAGLVDTPAVPRASGSRR
jgi:hypothetical protein